MSETQVAPQPQTILPAPPKKPSKKKFLLVADCLYELLVVSNVVPVRMIPNHIAHAIREANVMRSHHEPSEGGDKYNYFMNLPGIKHETLHNVFGGEMMPRLEEDFLATLATFLNNLNIDLERLYNQYIRKTLLGRVSALHSILTKNGSASHNFITSHPPGFNRVTKRDIERYSTNALHRSLEEYQRYSDFPSFPTKELPNGKVVSDYPTTGTFFEGFLGCINETQTRGLELIEKLQFSFNCLMAITALINYRQNLATYEAAVSKYKEAHGEDALERYAQMKSEARKARIRQLKPTPAPASTVPEAKKLPENLVSSSMPQEKMTTIDEGDIYARMAAAAAAKTKFAKQAQE